MEVWFPADSQSALAENQMSFKDRRKDRLLRLAAVISRTGLSEPPSGDASALARFPNANRSEVVVLHGTKATSLTLSPTLSIIVRHEPAKSSAQVGFPI